jgi:hypothetical protein
MKFDHAAWTKWRVWIDRIGEDLRSTFSDQDVFQLPSNVGRE